MLRRGHSRRATSIRRPVFDRLERRELLSTADLSVAAQLSSATVQWGDSFTYTLKVTNSGPDPARNVVVTEQLPANVAYSGPNFSDGFTYDSGTNTVTYTFPSDVPVGTSTSAAVMAYTTGPGADTTGFATVTSDTSDPNTANNRQDKNSNPAFPVLNVVQATADLSITGQPSASSVSADAGFTYQVVVKDLGPSIASDVAVSLPLPSNVTYDDAASPPTGFSWDSGSHTLTYTKSSLPVYVSGSASTVLTLSIPVHPTGTGTIAPFAASVTNLISDSNTANNSVSIAGVIVTPAQVAALRMRIDGPIAAQKVDSHFSYVVSLINTSNVTARGVRINLDPSTTGLSFDGSSPALGQPFDLAPGATSVPIQVFVTALRPSSAGTVALFMKATADNAPTVTQAYPTNVVATSVSVGLSQSASELHTGSVITDTVTIRNLGTTTLKNVSAKLTLPTGLTTSGKSSVKWTLTLSPGQTVTENVTVKVGATAYKAPRWRVITTASVSAGPTGGDSQNATATLAPIDLLTKPVGKQLQTAIKNGVPKTMFGVATLSSAKMNLLSINGADTTLSGTALVVYSVPLVGAVTATLGFTTSYLAPSANDVSITIDPSAFAAQAQPYLGTLKQSLVGLIAKYKSQLVQAASAG